MYHHRNVVAQALPWRQSRLLAEVVLSYLPTIEVCTRALCFFSGKPLIALQSLVSIQYTGANSCPLPTNLGSSTARPRRRFVGNRSNPWSRDAVYRESSAWTFSLGYKRGGGPLCHNLWGPLSCRGLTELTVLCYSTANHKAVEMIGYISDL